jgi:crotonobetainyl-CoA:carnitine CoA-transferase CaiB-like acyl-CoA transferase
VRGQAGNSTTYTAPSNMYRSSDGIWFSLVASSQGTYARLCEAVQRPEWLTDPRFATNPARVQHMGELDDTLSRWFGERAYAQIAARLEQHEIPFSKVFTIEDIEQDPHYIARQAIVRLPDPDYGSLPAPCIVPRIVGREMPVPRTGPALGEHNAEIYGRFGIGPERLVQLKAEKVV